MKFDIRLPNDVKFVLQELNNNGYESYVVGGCVRDSILGRVPHDWDICTSATPEQIIDSFKEYRIIETGLKHGTVTVVVSQNNYEITTYRIDGNYSDGRRPDNVEFTTNLIKDLERRDFTINAMAYNSIDGLIDPFNGLQDLESKVINCVGSANDRFNEDALRILRALRFASRYEFKINSETDAAIKMLYRNLGHISAERINNEFVQIIMSDNPVLYLSQYNFLFAFIIPELQRTFDFEQNNPYHIYDVWNHTLKALGYTSQDLIIRLSILFHDIGKPKCYSEDENGVGHFYAHGNIGADITNGIMKRLKFDNETREDVVQLIGYHDATLTDRSKHIKKWLNRIGELQFRKLLEIKICDIQGQNPAYLTERLNQIEKIKLSLDEILEQEQCFSKNDLEVKGKDLLGIGYTQGVQLGVTLDRLLDLVISDEIKNNKEELLDVAKTWLQIEV